MRSRCALLPTLGDPLISHLWLDRYKKTFKDEIDHLYVFINSPMSEDFIEYSRKLYEDAGATVIVENNTVSHGVALRKLFDISKESTILLIEEDCYPLKRGAIDRIFRGLESGEFDVAGSPRGSCGKELWDEAATRWGLDYSGYGDKGPNFWPNMFFTTRNIFSLTDLNFSERMYESGEFIPSLNYTVKEPQCGDTMVHMSLQIRNLKPVIREIPQYHGSAFDLNDFYERTGIYAPDVTWVHTGSSSSLLNIVRDTSVPDTLVDADKLELERRLSWWILSWEDFSDSIDNPSVKRVMNTYVENVNNIIMRGGLSVSNIKILVKSYRGLCA